MRMCLLFLGIAGCAVLAGGQTARAQGAVTSVTAPWQQLTARSIERTPSTGIWRLRGSVQIEQDTAVITADEVDARIAPDGTLEYDLRGNVHLTIRPHK
jgi:lipopolysaccharide export system protein LptA